MEDSSDEPQDEEEEEEEEEEECNHHVDYFTDMQKMVLTCMLRHCHHFVHSQVNNKELSDVRLRIKRTAYPPDSPEDNRTVISNNNNENEDANSEYVYIYAHKYALLYQLCSY